jgi:transcriptional regulator with XRE-family HTH domain
MPNRSPAHSGDPALKRLGKAIRLARIQAGYSQEGFALDVGIDRSYYGAIERGENNVTVLNLVKISKALRTAKFRNLFNRLCGDISVT